MPRFPKPWYRRRRRLWYVRIDGKQINLGRDRGLAFACYHDLMRRPQQANVNADSVVGIIDAFLEWCRDRLQWFVETLPPGRREAFVSADEFATILDCVGDQQFRDFLLVTYETGARR